MGNGPCFGKSVALCGLCDYPLVSARSLGKHRRIHIRHRIVNENLENSQSLIAEASTGDNVPRIPVVPGETIGISVDPVVADSGWSPVIGQQRLVSTPLETTYYRFTYPDLQEIPPDGVLLQVVAGRGDAAKGIWVFRLERA